MLSTEIIFYFKLFIILFYIIGGVVFMNPLINLLKLNFFLKRKIEDFFCSTGFFGYWGVFTNVKEQSRDIRITAKTSQGDCYWYLVRDRKSIPFLKIHSDNSMVLFTHHLNDELFSKLIYGNLVNRIFKFYQLKNIKLLEVKIESISLQSGSEKDYMHDLSRHPYLRYFTYMHWKDGEEMPKITEKL